MTTTILHLRSWDTALNLKLEPGFMIMVIRKWVGEINVYLSFWSSSLFDCLCCVADNSDDEYYSVWLIEMFDQNLVYVQFYILFFYCDIYFIAMFIGIISSSVIVFISITTTIIITSSHLK